MLKRTPNKGQNNGQNKGQSKTKTILIAFIAIGILLVLIFRARSNQSSSQELPATKIAANSDVAGASLPNGASEPLEFASPAPIAKPIGKSNLNLTEADQQKIQVLDQILQSHNDNDPRLDKEFRDLSPELKAALQLKYQAMSVESRNDRGTVVFLLGREMKSADDARFLAGVISEPACLSLEDCSHRPTTAVDEHAAMANEITVVYPQIVAVKSFERCLAQANASPAASNGDLRGVAIEALHSAERSENPKVAQAAHDALGKISQ
jgi:hypothetical protein